MLRYKSLSICSVAALLSLLLAGSVAADVTVKGKVEYWDQLRGGYYPCRGVHVEVEGDWFWFFDPDVLTDNNGFYSAKVSDPPWWWDNYDGVDIEVYAETGGVVQVYTSMWSWWPYHAISHEVNNVTGGQVVTINMRIGGPSNNASEAYYRTMAETANAFALHERAMDEYRTLLSKGWPKSDFDEVEILVPAATPTGISYYNHATGFVNIAMSAAGKLGLGSWATITSGNYKYGTIEHFRNLIQHEYGHNIHDEMSGLIPPLGLSMPTYHSPEKETNRFVAYTEGLAEFFPMAINNVTGNQFDASMTVPNVCTMANIPKTGDHWAMEAEVAGTLWDIFDPVGSEPFRHPAVRTADNAIALPQNLIYAQRWTDRIQDPSLAKIRQVVKSYVYAWPVQTIGEFLDEYKTKYPNELHAIKSIAYNRDITVNMPAERPAILTGTPTVSRFLSQINVKLELSEPDPEDRPFVSVFVWLQKGAGITYILKTAEQKNWTSGNWPLSFSFNLPQAAGPGDLLWFIVSDDMQPMAYSVGVPANNVTANIDLPELPDLTDLKIRNDMRILETQNELVMVPGSRITAKVKQPDTVDSQKLKSLKDSISQAGKALRDYADARELALRQERGLFKLSRNIGDLKAAGEEDRIFFKRPLQANTTEPHKVSKSDASVVQFEQWKNRVRRNTGLTRTLSESDAANLKRQVAMTAGIIQKQQEAGRRLAVMRNQLQASLTQVLNGQQEGALRTETQRAVAELDKALARAAGDTALVNHLREQNELMQKIAVSSGKFVIAKEQQIMIDPKSLEQAGAAPRIPDISGRWNSNIRAVYNITQNGANFTWTRLGTREIGEGSIDGTTIRATWGSGNSPRGSSSGAIVEVNNAGIAQRITWENGVVFFR